MKDFRLKRLFNPKSGRCFDVAVDHGFFNEPGFLKGIESMPKTIETLVAAAGFAVESARWFRGLLPIRFVVAGKVPRTLT